MRMSWDASCNMGYIYLMPPCRRIGDKNYKSIASYLHLDETEIDIPLIEGYDLKEVFNNMKLMKNTYSKAVNVYGEVSEEFKNDIDKRGYLKGVELSISKGKLTELFKEKAFRIYETSWKSRDYYLLTLDVPKSVFDHTNIIYPLTNKSDVFIIVQIYSEYRIGYIKGLLTTKNEIYPIEYLTKPQFILLGY